MKKIILIKPFLLAFIGLSHLSLALENSPLTTASYAQTDCAAKALLASDKAVKKAYQRLKKQLSPEIAKGLAQTQQDWQRHRDMACGKGNIECHYRANRERTQYLQDRLKECKAGACQINAITRQSWYTY